MRKAAIGFALFLCLPIAAFLAVASGSAGTNATIADSAVAPKEAEQTNRKVTPPAGSGTQEANQGQNGTQVIPLQLAEAKGGKLVLVMATSSQKAFTLTLKNPIGGAVRRVNVHASIQFQREGDSDVANAKVLPMGRLTLRPGEEVGLRVTFDRPPSGKYRGLLRCSYEGELFVEDADKEPAGQQSADTDKKFLELRSADSGKLKTDQPFVIVIVNPFLMCGGTVVVFILVVLGSIASLLLNKSLPISAAKAKNRQRIADLEEQAQPLTVFEHPLRDKIAVELNRLKTLNDNTKVWTPSAQARFNKIDQILEKTEKDLNTREKIRQCYLELNAKRFMHPPEEKAIRDILKDADNNLFQDHRDAAERRLEEAVTRLKQEDGGERHIKRDENLHKEIQRLLKRLKSFIGEEYKYIEYLLREAEELLERIDKLDTEKDMKESQDKIGQLELIFRKLDIFNTFQEYLNSDTQEMKGKYQKNSLQFMKYLRSDEYDDIEKAFALCNSLGQYGKDESDFEEAFLGEDKFHVLSYPPDPQIDRPVEFHLEFVEDAFNQSPLRSRYRCIWNFGDQTKETEGFRVVHFYKRHGKFILARKWIKRSWFIVKARLGKGGKNLQNIFREYDLKIKVLSTTGKEIKKYSKNLPVFEALEKDYSSGVTLLDGLGYGITLLISCAIAVSTYDGAECIKTLKDVLTPFLLGFGLDISKEKIMAPAKAANPKAVSKGVPPQTSNT
jgi:hypothetical protein